MQTNNLENSGDEKNQSPPSDEIKSQGETESSKNYMTEEEVREIITRYNTDLNVILLENEKNKEKIKELEKSSRESELRAKHTREENAKLENEKDHYKQMYEDLQNEIKTKEELIAKDQLEKILRFSQQEHENPSQIAEHQIIENEVKDENHKASLNKFLKEFEVLNSNFKDLSEKYQTLLNTYNEVKTKTEEIESNKHKTRSCILCRNEYYPDANHENSCQHHSGKLKYYSCRDRGCGADEYYYCCNRCTTCSKGCKTGKHVSTE